jgi:HlyD family secretion protein
MEKMASTSQRSITETEPIVAPAGPAPNDAPPQHAVTGRKRKPSPWQKPGFWMAFAALAIIVIGVVMYRRGQPTTQTSGNADRIAKVERRDFVRTVRVQGTVEAVVAHPIVAPRLAIQTANVLTLTTLMPTGTHVKKGDLLAEFDRQAQTRDALDRQAEFNDLEQQINKLKATQAADKASDDTDIKAAEDSLANAQLEVKRSEIMSRIDAEKKKEDLDEATAKLKQLRETYSLRRQSATAALKLLQIQLESKRLAVDHANKNADLLAIHAPNDGLVVVNSTFKSSGFSEWQNGDQVRAGTPFMQVVNPGAMRVRGMVNQQDVPQMQAGQKVDVRLDAYPEMVFHGHLDLISSVGVSDDFSQKLHTFMMLFVIDGKDAKLLPDLSAAVDVELERLPNVLIVPRDSLVSEDGKFNVRVLSSNSSEKREVRVLQINDVDAAVEAKLQPGETVIRGVAPEVIQVASASAATPKK